MIIPICEMRKQSPRAHSQQVAGLELHPAAGHQSPAGHHSVTLLLFDCGWKVYY